MIDVNKVREECERRSRELEVMRENFRRQADDFRLFLTAYLEALAKEPGMDQIDFEEVDSGHETKVA